MSRITTSLHNDARTVRTPRYRSRVGDHHGVPALFVNDRPIFLNAPYLFKAPFESFAEADTGIYLVHDLHIPISRDGHVDITAVSCEIDDLLTKDADAMIVVRSFPPSPDWWLDQHPDEEQRFDREVARYGEIMAQRETSWGSDPWLTQVCEWYEQWCAALHARYGGQVIGHQFGMGSHGENNPLGACASDGRWFCGDFSPAMQGYFRQWLRRRYPAADDLRKAWSDPAVTHDAAIPTRLRRLQTDWFTFRSPTRRQVADYYEAFAERVEACVISICRAIKRSTDGACIAGSHLGALMDNGFHGYLYHQTCINICRHALADPAVDTFTSPASYEGRFPGGDANTMMPTGSVALHDKLILQDQDTRTSVLPPGYRESFTLGAIAADIPESISPLAPRPIHTPRRP